MRLLRLALLKRRKPRISHARYYGRWASVAAGIVGVSLAAGVCGYHYTEHLSWLDALLNASMILGGMGPVDTLHSPGGKLFASLYALYSCFIVIGVAGVLLMPLFHLTLRRFHSDPEN